MTRLVAFEPRVARQAFGFAQPFAQTLLHGERRVNRFAADFLDADALDEVVRAFEEVRVLAVVLKEESRRLERFLCRLDGDEQVRLANFFPRGAANDHLPRTFLAYDADVFHGRFRAISRAAHGAHFYFCRRVEMFEAALEFDTRFRGILHAEAAEVSADAGFHHAHAFGVRLAAGHAKVCPNVWQIRFLHAEKIDALAACYFDHRNFVFFGDIGDAAELFSGSDAAAHARYDGKRAVFLNVGVNAVVDVAG